MQNNSVSANGNISGIDEFGFPMHGFCKNGTAFFSEDYGDIYLEGYFISSGTKVGRHLGSKAFIYNYETSWHAASISKVSSSTVRLATKRTALSKQARSYLKVQESQRESSTRARALPED